MALLNSTTLVFDNNLQYFLVESSMIGLTISLALYSFIIPQMKKIFDAQAQRLRKAKKRLKGAREKLAKKLMNEKFCKESEEELQEEFQLAKEEVLKEQDIKFHHGKGFLITGVLFSLSTVFPLLNIFINETNASTTVNNFVIAFTKISPWFLIGGVGLLIFIWFKVFVDIKEILRKILSEAIEEADKELEKAKKFQERKLQEKVSVSDNINVKKFNKSV